MALPGTRSGGAPGRRGVCADVALNLRSVPARLLALIALIAAVLLGAGALPVAAQAATGTPTIALSAGGSSSALYGSPATVSLTASNPAGQPTGYNLTMEDVLPAGVSYVANSSSFSGQDVEPQVFANEPSAGKTTLIWSNLSDLSPNSQAKLTYQEQASTSTYAVGGSYTESQSAYVNTSPRTVPTFNAAGTPVLSSYTGSATTTATTTLSALQVTSSDAVGAKLLRGVHAHQTVYALTVTNNGVKPTSATVLDAYLPAGLEFLGCATADNTTSAATNPGSTEEWPGSGALSGQGPNPGSCSGYTEVQTGTFTPGHGILSGFYTHVQYSPGTLPAGQAVTYKFVAGIPIRENTNTWTGTKPSDASGDQAANLDNNSGTETYDGESLPTYALATGSYNGTTAVAATSTDTVTAKDDIITKSVDSGNITIGNVDTWALNVVVGEYRYVQNLQVTDTLPNGTCPLDSVNHTTSSECAPQSGELPSSPYTTITQNSNGTWTETWNDSTDSALAELVPDATAAITIPVAVRPDYQSNGSATTPVVAGDTWSGSVNLQSADYVRCGSPANADCSVGGTKIDHDMADGTVITDSSSAGQSSAQPAISKLIDDRASVPVSCATDNYVSTTPNYNTGDTVCYKLHIAFPAGVYTGSAAITDFLPPGTTYNAGSWQTTASNTVTVGTVDSTTNPGVLSVPLGSGGYVSPGQVLDAVYSVTIVDPTKANQYDIKGNLMKFANVNAAGQSFPQRAAANYEFSKPLLGLTEGVYQVDGAPSSGNGAGTTGVSVQGGDTVTMRVDVKNTGGLDAVNTEVWEDMPSQLSCSNFSNVTATPSTCVGGSPSTVKWTGVSVPAGQTVTLYYTYTVPSGSYPNQNLTSDAGVVDYQNAADSGADFTNIPASNIDPSVSTFVGTPNTQAANGTAYTYIAAPTVATTDTTSVTAEAGNIASQATIGETITYTSTVTIPAGANEGADGQFIGQPDNTNTTYVPGSLTATLNGAALPGGWTSGEDSSSGLISVVPPSDYTPAAAHTLVVTWSDTVNDVSTNYAGQIRVGTGFWYYNGGASGTLTTPSSSVANTIVEPKLTATLTDNTGGARVTPGQTVTYTTKLTDPSGSNVSSANHAIAVVAVPVGETPVNAGTPVADGGTVGGGGNGVWSQSARTITFPSTSQILPGANPSYAYTVTVDNPQPSSTQLTNTLAASATSLLNPPTSPGTARTATSAASLTPPVSGYSASTNNTVQLVDATVAKTVSAPSATIGDPETYTVNVSIPAGVNLYDAMVRDIVPDGVSYDGLVSATCTSGCGTPSDLPVSEIPHPVERRRDYDARLLARRGSRELQCPHRGADLQRARSEHVPHRLQGQGRRRPLKRSRSGRQPV